MIIEFAGLPGAGKSTLQQALYSELAAIGKVVQPRDMVRQQVIAEHIPLDRSGPWRKLSTAGYKLLLTGKAMTTRMALSSEVAQGHLRRAHRRLIESHLIVEHVRENRLQAEWIDLDEGLVQNYWSLQVWRRLLRPTAPAIDAVWSDQTFDRSPHVVIVLTAPVTLALERLTNRGRPDGWPTGLSSESILASYEAEMHSVLAKVQSSPLHLLSVDAGCQDWSDVVRDLTRSLVQLGDS